MVATGRRRPELGKRAGMAVARSASAIAAGAQDESDDGSARVLVARSDSRLRGAPYLSGGTVTRQPERTDRYPRLVSRRTRAYRSVGYGDSVARLAPSRAPACSHRVSPCAKRVCRWAFSARAAHLASDETRLPHVEDPSRTRPWSAPSRTPLTIAPPSVD